MTEYPISFEMDDLSTLKKVCSLFYSKQTKDLLDLPKAERALGTQRA